MANHVLCIFLAIGHFSAGTLVVDTKPDTIYPGLTSDLTVNCSFLYNNQPNISTIISLIISKAESHNNQTGSFTEIVSVNTFTNQVNYMDSTNAVAFGTINSDTLNSFLSLSWSYPSQAEGGFYRCDAHGLDNIGHPISVFMLAEVISSNPDLNALIGIMGTFQTDLALIKKKLDTQVQAASVQNSTIDALKTTIDAQNSTISSHQQEIKDQFEDRTNLIIQLQTRLDQQEKQVSDLQEAMFLKSSTYKGHHYLLSGLYVEHIDLAEYFCNLCHGYLIEIEDKSEYDFIVSFLNFDGYHHGVMVGATRDEQTGHWMFRHSGHPVSFFNWASGEPGTERRNCMLMQADEWKMYDIYCAMSIDHTFMCEVPES